MRAEVHAYTHFVHLLFEPQIRRSGVYRVTADDDERVDLSACHRGGQVANGLNLIDRVRFDGIGVQNRLACIGKRCVHRMR